ncbi:MAG: thiamine phosphate synthase [Candidatus Omnitrophica bacterium]|nr:thiamine phosphate synthase [Candidatus Omnitrophota bacterium]
MKLKRGLGKEFRLYVLVNYSPNHREEKVLRFAQDIIEAGADVVQLRTEKKTDKEFLSIASKIKEWTHKAGISFIVNNRPDIALAVDAEGVHLGQNDLPIDCVRKIISQKIVGKSAHNIIEAIEAEREGADYIGIGPVFPSSTKPNLFPTGLSLIQEVKEKTALPFTAIGGINLSNIKEVIKAGAKSVAVCSAIKEAENPRAVVKEFKRILRD